MDFRSLESNVKYPRQIPDCPVSLAPGINRGQQPNAIFEFIGVASRLIATEGRQQGLELLVSDFFHDAKIAGNPPTRIYHLPARNCEKIWLH